MPLNSGFYARPFWHTIKFYAQGVGGTVADMLNPMSEEGRATEAPLLQAIGITKFYGNFLANNRIDLELFPRQIHALLGENGAGKSTLVKMIYGAAAAERRRDPLEGQPIAIANPDAARGSASAWCSSISRCSTTLTVAENIALASCRKAIRHDAVRQRIDEISRAYGLRAEPERAGRRLSVGERQRIEIVRCLLQTRSC